ncbi:MAG: S-methyl-5'-thioinosine phosphorylase [Pseudomonadota bacterium]|nr:S-methyl-5'-thioinosine phosphorylase [Pseudomonadota bacterium]
MTMSKVAIIGGTGLTSLQNLQISGREIMHTPYGEPSSTLVRGKLGDNDVLFLPRHGSGHTITPHRINYRANLWALKEAGAEMIIAVNAIGGIQPEFQPGSLVIPDQIIDYTWGRSNTFFDEGDNPVVHVDFTWPYSASLRQALLTASKRANVAVIDKATYGATQGPRLETAAEINKLEADGCNIVGMTGMPEAVLARELEVSYASIGVVANLAAGRHDGEITMEEIEQHLAEGMKNVRTLLEHVIPLL